MSVRKASTTLQRVSRVPALVEREPGAVEREWGALEWQGTVRMAAERAAGTSAATRQAHVRTGLLERTLVLGADHAAGPHDERPETGRRLLGHIDALAEAGCSPADLVSFAEEAELDRPGALWVLSILFGCLDANDAEDVFEDWAASLDMALFPTYRGVVEIAEALAVLPDRTIPGRAGRWLGGSSPVLQAVALESMSLGELSDERLLRLSRTDSPIVMTALERLVCRASKEAVRPLPPRASWLDVTVPGLAYEVAQARILMRDFEPLMRLRQRDERALSALGPCSLDVLALAGDGSDSDLASELARGFPSTAGLLSSLGRLGLPSLFPRLLAELDNRDFEDEAEEALVTALGPRPESVHERSGRPGNQGAARMWEQATSRLPKTTVPVRLRGGEPYGLRSVVSEMNRPGLSPLDLRVRAAELFVEAGTTVAISWGAFGLSLERALSDLARLAR